MRLTIPVICASGILCAAIALVSPGTIETRLDNHGGVPPDMRWQLARTADPVTGEVPSGALMRAYRQLQEKGFNLQSAQYRVADVVHHWEVIDDQFPTLSITRITYDPSNTNTFYFCTGEGWYNFDAVKGDGVFRSDDAGESWYQLAATDTSLFDYCQDMVVHPVTGDIYVATRTGGLQRSTDGGASFQKVLGYGVGSTRNSVCDIELTADGGVFAAIGIFETDGIYFSPTGDPGTFVKQTTGLPTSGYFRIEMATAPSDANVAYSIFCNSTDYKVKGVYKTTDKGANWFAINTPDNNLEFAAKQAWYDLSLAVSPGDADVVAMGGLHLWRTRDGGDTWDQISSGGLDSNLVRFVHVDQHEVTFHTDDEVYFGNDGGIWRTENFSDEHPFIYHRNTGYAVTQFYAGAMHPETTRFDVMGGTQDNGTPYIDGTGFREAKMVSGGDGAFVAFDYTDPETFYTASQLRRMFRFNNGGFEFPDTITNPNLNDANVLFINPFIMDASDPEILFMCSNLGLWRFSGASTSDTSGWSKAASIGGVLTAVETSPAAPGVVFLGKQSGAGEIYRLDTAYTSNSITTPLNIDPFDSLPDAAFTGQLYCSSIVADKENANHVIVTYSNYNVNSIWESFDALSLTPTWHSIEGDLPDIPVYWSAMHPLNDEVVYIATEMGVFYTDQTNGYETHWIPSSGFPRVRTDQVKIREDGQLLAVTHGRGFWQGDIGLGTGGTSNEAIWTERGPASTGGRTRTIMVDPNDPTGKTVWAGSVSGGLWKTTNIDAVDVVPSPVQEDFAMVIAPNPALQALYLTLTLPEGVTASVSLYDLQGRKVAQIASGAVDGRLEWTIPAALPSGNYLVEAVSAGKRQVGRVVIL